MKSAATSTPVSKFKSKQNTAFRSPLRASSNGVPPGDNESYFALSAELKKLEQRVNVLRNAVKIQKMAASNSDQSDGRLEVIF